MVSYGLEVVLMQPIAQYLHDIEEHLKTYLGFGDARAFRAAVLHDPNAQQIRQALANIEFFAGNLKESLPPGQSNIAMRDEVTSIDVHLEPPPNHDPPTP